MTAVNVSRVCGLIMPLPYPTATVFLRSSTVPFSKIIHNEAENTEEMRDFIIYLI